MNAAARPVREHRRSFPVRPGMRASMFAAGCLFFGILSLVLGQENGYDLRYYHYYLPYAFLNGRIAYDYAPAQLQSYLNPLSFVPFYLLAAHAPPSLTAFLLGGWHGLTFGLIFALAYELFRSSSTGARRGWSFLCAVLGTCAPVFLGTLGGSYNDVTVAQLILLALLLLWRCWRAAEPGREHWAPGLLASGVLLGAAIGLKLVAAIYAVAAFLGLLALPQSWRCRLRVGSMYAALLALGFLTTAGYWMLLLWTRFESPTFPFFNVVFRSPYYPATNFADKRFLPQGFVETISYPVLLLSAAHREANSGVRDARYALLVLLGLAVVLRRGWGGIVQRTRAQPSRRRSGRSAARALPAPSWMESFVLLFFATAYVLWQSQFAILRYAAPLEALAPLAMTLLVRRLASGRALHGLAIALASAATLGLMRPPQNERIRRTDDYIDVRAPRFQRPEHVLVVVAHNAPWSFVVPFLQPEIRVLGLVSNLTKPGDGTRFQAEMRDIVARHQGEMYLLSDEGYLQGDVSLLREHYGLLRANGPCHRIDTRHQSIPIILCPVRRAAP